MENPPVDYQSLESLLDTFEDIRAIPSNDRLSGGATIHSWGLTEDLHQSTPNSSGTRVVNDQETSGNHHMNVFVKKNGTSHVLGAGVTINIAMGTFPCLPNVSEEQ